MKLSRRLHILEQKAGVNQPERNFRWSDKTEEILSRILARPDYKDFTIGMWGVVKDKDGNVVD
jgi:hypothetical protein